MDEPPTSSLPDFPLGGEALDLGALLFVREVEMDSSAPSNRSDAYGSSPTRFFGHREGPRYVSRLKAQPKVYTLLNKTVLKKLNLSARINGGINWIAVLQFIHQCVDYLNLPLQNLYFCQFYSEPLPLVDLRKRFHFARIWRPFHFEEITGYMMLVDILRAMPYMYDFATRLLECPQDRQRGGHFQPNLFSEFPPSNSLKVKIVFFDQSLWNGPSTIILIFPKWTAWVTDKYHQLP